MTPEELSNQLRMHGVEARVRGKEVQIQTCVWCGNAKWNLELAADKGVYHCWVCRQKGRLEALLEQITGQRWSLPHTERRPYTGAPTGPLPTTVEEDMTQWPSATMIPAARQYLHQRGLSDAVVTEYAMRVCPRPSHRLAGRVIVPVREFWTGAAVGSVARTYTRQQPKYLATLTHRQIVGWRQRNTTIPYVVAEGVFDGIAIHQAGYHAAVMLGVEMVALEAFAARVPHHIPLILAWDGDATDKAYRVRARLSPIHPRILVLELPAHADPATVGAEALQDRLLRIQ